MKTQRIINEEKEHPEVRVWQVIVIGMIVFMGILGSF